METKNSLGFCTQPGLSDAWADPTYEMWELAESVQKWLHEECDAALLAPCPCCAEQDVQEPENRAWEAFVAYAYQDGKDGARVIQQITEHYLKMRTERDRLQAEFDAAPKYRMHSDVSWMRQVEVQAKRIAELEAELEREPTDRNKWEQSAAEFVAAHGGK